MIHEFDPVIYPRKIWITHDATAKELNDKFECDSRRVIFGDDDLESSYGVVYSVGVKEPENKGGYLIRFENKDVMNSANITHECIHAAVMILSYIGFKNCMEDDEPLAYLAAWIAKCCDTVKQYEESKGY